MRALLEKICRVLSLLYIVLVAVILLQVGLRYAFSLGSIALEELQWHLFGVAMMMGLAWSELNDAHVGVDLFSKNFSPARKRWIETFGSVFFVLPFCVVVIVHSIPFVLDSFRVMESSLSPSGLPYRWVIKAFLPLSVLCWLLARFVRLKESWSAHGH